MSSRSWHSFMIQVLLPSETFSSFVVHIPGNFTSGPYFFSGWSFPGHLHMGIIADSLGIFWFSDLCIGDTSLPPGSQHHGKA